MLNAGGGGGLKGGRLAFNLITGLKSPREI